MLAYLLLTFLAVISAVQSDPGQPLFLTPYIESGQIAKAQNLSKVPSLVPGQDAGYSGYITVNKTTNGNLFFWFFPTLRNASKVPVVVWLQGGPGASSMFGLFVENGPLQIDRNGQAGLRAVALTALYNTLYIDQPVGTGYSFVDDPNGYTKSEVDVAEHLYNFLQQFYQLFPQFRQQDLYISGESYAGKYVPAIAFKIEMEKHKKSPTALPLKGVLIGNGYSDPMSMELPTGFNLYSNGLIDKNQLSYFYGQCSIAFDYINNGMFSEAFDLFDKLMDGDFWPYGTWFKNATGCTVYYNFEWCTQMPDDTSYYQSFIVKDDVRAAIHVGNKTYNDGDNRVELNLKNDVYDTVKPWVEFMLQNTELRWLFYSGNMDLIVPTIATDAFLRSLKWPHQGEWILSNRSLWSPTGSDPAGYAMQVDKLNFVVIRNAGHMVPYQQPQAAMYLFDAFIKNMPWHSAKPNENEQSMKQRLEHAQH